MRAIDYQTTPVRGEPWNSSMRITQRVPVAERPPIHCTHVIAGPALRCCACATIWDSLDDFAAAEGFGCRGPTPASDPASAARCEAREG